MNIVDGHIDLDDLQTGHSFHRLLDITLNAPSEIYDAGPVFDHDVQVNRGLSLADLHAYALRDVGARATWNPLSNSAKGPGSAGAHCMYSGNLPACHASDLLHDALRHAYPALIAA